MAASMASYVENFISGFDDSAAKLIAKHLAAKDVSWTEIIEDLGQYLTSPTTSTRARATRLIADILHYIPNDLLTEKEVNLLITYICEKLKDHHSLQPPALYGLLALCKAPHLSSEDLSMVCHQIFTEVNCQSLAQGDRRIVFNLFYALLTTRLKDVQKLGGDFIIGFIQMMDSEKDPRNLVISFACAQIIIRNIPLGAFKEEMFEVVSCYFPIDFSPSQTDPSGIKKEDLILGLRACLAASPLFAEYCLPLLMEKLTSELKSAKIDALETLAACAKTYGANNLYEFQSAFFSSIKKEVFLSGDPAVETAALSALTSLVTAIATGVTTSNKRHSLEGFVDEILQECKNHLLQPELMLMLSTGRLLQSVAMATSQSCDQVVRAVMPLLVDTFNKQTQSTPKHNVVLVVNGFIGVTQCFTYSDNNPNPILTYKAQLVDMYKKSLGEDTSSIQVLGLRGLDKLLVLGAQQFSPDEVSDVAQLLLDTITQVACEDSVRCECTDVLRNVMCTNPSLAENTVYPTLFKLLHNENMEVPGQECLDRPGVLEVIAGITKGSHCLQLATKEIYKLLNNETFHSLYPSVTKCLARLSSSCSSDPACLGSLTGGVKVIHNLVVSRCRVEAWYRVLSDVEVLSNLAEFIRHQAAHWDHSVSSEMQSLFMESFFRNVSSNDNQDNFCPLKASCDTVFVSLLTPVLASGTKQCDHVHFPELTARLAGFMLEPLDPAPHLTVCKCLAAIINKEPLGKTLDELLTSIKDKLTSVLELQGQGHHVSALSWVTKALVLRGHSFVKDFVNMMFNLLGSSDLGHSAAAGFCTLLTDQSDVLTSEMHANIRIMYRQRFFVEYLSSIVSGYQASGPETKQNWLLALSYLMQGLDKHVLIPELNKIYPLLVQSLLQDDLDLQLVTMETLSDLICSAPEVISKQIDSLIPKLLKMTTYKPSMKVRISALKCLAGLCSLPIPVLVPYKAQVVRALVPVLGDRKRLVRAQAVTARQEWIMFDAEDK
ncbi:MMS19 nucleotide excision repair protein homolog isoform X2 [Dreissena polymorpha]|uniref:MMS19 nucleotide excision repair protein homolog isoform X2 n=1 Tax=Dreissena polymorpha TaxID=45954 RepID=UPI0022644B0B|nr:MMS19 nucleotide excision repair protein homolog isoform X2 [Dreissena polymorpha]